MEQAVKASHQQSVEMASKIAGGMLERMVPKLHGVQKLSCKAEKEGSGYLCEVELDTENVFTGRSKTVSSVRLVKGSEGWILAE